MKVDKGAKARPPARRRPPHRELYTGRSMESFIKIVLFIGAAYRCRRRFREKATYLSLDRHDWPSILLLRCFAPLVNVTIQAVDDSECLKMRKSKYRKQNRPSSNTVALGTNTFKLGRHHIDNKGHWLYPPRTEPERSTEPPNSKLKYYGMAKPDIRS
ncbi:hypothetical protein EVAR_36882_1 [Eumeta japonica]|uniref:Uncharacterized protein n=1 Tax=Eumeta variegata TaxID=151549 RepID=A0A4C1WUU8_EUMVA|nr:hypothetical protein EVAR_36882_1 [Eumeta japonica]